MNTSVAHCGWDDHPVFSRLKVQNLSRFFHYRAHNLPSFFNFFSLLKYAPTLLILALRGTRACYIKPSKWPNSPESLHSTFATDAQTSLEGTNPIGNITFSSQSSFIDLHWVKKDCLIDLLHDTRHLCTRFRIDGIKPMSRGISGHKQVIKCLNTSNRNQVWLFSQNERTN